MPEPTSRIDSRKLILESASLTDWQIRIPEPMTRTDWLKQTIEPKNLIGLLRSILETMK